MSGCGVLASWPRQATRQRRRRPVVGDAGTGRGSPVLGVSSASSGVGRPSPAPRSIVPAAWIASRSAARTSAASPSRSVSISAAIAVADVLGERRAGPAGADRDRDPPPSGDRREDERAVRRVVGGVDPARPRLPGVGRDRGVDLRVVGGGDHQLSPVEVAGSVRAPARRSPPGSTIVVVDLRGDHGDHGAGRDAGPATLRSGDAATADDQHRRRRRGRGRPGSRSARRAVYGTGDESDQT